MAAKSTFAKVKYDKLTMLVCKRCGWDTFDPDLTEPHDAEHAAKDAALKIVEDTEAMQRRIVAMQEGRDPDDEG